MHKKILIIAHYFPPQNAIASLRPYSWAKYWSRLGHDVTVLTIKKESKDNDLNFDCTFFNTIEVENTFKENVKKYLFGSKGKGKESKSLNTSFKRRFINKVKLFFLSRGAFSTSRMPDFNYFIIANSLDKVKDKDFDIVVSTSGPHTSHIIAQNLKQQNKDILWIADYRDLWTLDHIHKGIFPFTLIEEYMEKKINNNADVITTVSEPLSIKLRNKYKLNNIETIENGFDFEDLKQIPENKYWNDNKIRLVYTGSIYLGKRDPSPLFKAINHISLSENKEVLSRLEVVFVGGNMADLEELIFKHNVSSWVQYKGYLPREDSLRMQRDADGLIFLEYEADGVDGILTGKLFEYICSGTQIVGIGITDKSSAGELILKSGHGINFGKDSYKIEKYLLDLLKRDKKFIFEKNVEIINKYSREALAERMLCLAEKYKK